MKQWTIGITVVDPVFRISKPCSATRGLRSKEDLQRGPVSWVCREKGCALTKIKEVCQQRNEGPGKTGRKEGGRKYAALPLQGISVIHSILPFHFIKQQFR